MKFRMALAALLVVDVAVSGQASAQVLTLKPTTPWNLDGSESGCALRRASGDAERPMVLEMKKFSPGDRFQLSVQGNELASLMSSHRVGVSYGSAPATTPFQAGTTKRAKEKAVPTIFLTSDLANKPATEDDDGTPHLVSPEMEANAKDVTLPWGRKRITLATGSLAKPFAAMRQCTDERVRSWGLDPELQNQRSKAPKPHSLMAMVVALQKRYPAGISSGAQARVNFRMMVDASGIPTDCIILQSYNEPEFDKVTCDVLNRVTRFEPALDANGKPMASYYTSTVLWTT